MQRWRRKKEIKIKPILIEMWECRRKRASEKKPYWSVWLCPRCLFDFVLMKLDHAALWANRIENISPCMDKQNEMNTKWYIMDGVSLHFFYQCKLFCHWISFASFRFHQLTCNKGSNDIWWWYQYPTGKEPTEVLKSLLMSFLFKIDRYKYFIPFSYMPMKSNDLLPRKIH